MQRLASDGLFVAFLKKNKWVLLLLLLLLAGALMILLSDASPANTDSEEQMIAAACASIDGVGRVEVIVNKKEGEVVSCAVLCDGADSVSVVADVKALLSSLYGIGYNRIGVLKLSE